MTVGRSSNVIRFGVFEVDLRAGELRKQGLKLRLPEQSFQILAMLLEHPGELVTREEIQKRLWPDDTIVEFENSISAAIRRLRLALGDSADEPRFVETLARRGYRLTVPIERAREESDRPEQSGADVEAQMAASSHWARRWLWGISSVLLAGLAVLFYLWTRPLPAPRVLRTTQITDDGTPKSSVLLAGGFLSTILATDGSRIFFNNRTSILWGQLVQVAAGGGETVAIPVAIPTPIQGTRLLDISPGGASLLITSHRWVGVGALWIVPTLGGSPRKLGDVVASAAAWSPDGSQIAYANASELFVANGDGSHPRKLASLPKPVGQLRWSTDQSLIRLTLGEMIDPSKSIWQVAADGTNLHPLLPGWNNPPAECCGHWTPDGKYFVFLSTREGVTNIWAIREKAGLFRKAGREPFQLTTGPMHFHNLVPSRDGKKLFVLGVKLRGEVVRYDAQSRQLAPYLGGMSALLLDFTRDGQWVVYVTYPEGSLWRSRLDGSDRLQLTFPPMRVNLPRWSPDGKSVAFCAWAAPGRPSKVYVVSAAGGAPEEQIPDEVTPQYDPCWSPDGNSLAWGRVPKELDPTVQVPLAIYNLNLKTRQISTLPGSQGRFHPEWSPDGRYIAAYHEDWHMVLFDFASQKWTDVTNSPVAYHKWSKDGKYVLFNNGPRIYRMRVTDLKVEPVATLGELRPALPWYGYAPDDAPLAFHDVGTQEIYALDVDFP
jgi:Tol biopolymer transport system component/DNA-binding winged helix-turn-helix (wHTH) protein